MSGINAEDAACLKKLALIGGIMGPIRVSTRSIGDMLGISQQTASRRLQSLERNHMVTRITDSNGHFVLVTQEGEKFLRREFSEFFKIFTTASNQYVMTGVIVSGVGEGRYYMSIPHYQNQFAGLCGFTPYPGTLNVKLNPLSIQIRNKLESLEWMFVPGFKDEHRQFGDARCLKCKIAEIPCAIVAPIRTHHPSEIIEVIGEDRLREKLGLIDGSSIEVIIQTTQGTL
ncbi:MAG TPA: DUF120 domain-containing protein [Methanocorpusculum sp.]|nr:DUF120 domain-containing protein [Methanocorpusculum sp.]